ncbi:hypothetical protein [Nonomuraea gerenzanensis]|uniref:hypothetical protein n=1 Tax=Nonomuraea gerenzanensis TaxID=93944 RepID=UPI001CD9D249|nr:hypothetical protein [Nonomuraea gerenzanensis]UBU16635.1 hypothetical protein LCN96_16940 [Nonomuraea gerenzanensis]
MTVEIKVQPYQKYLMLGVAIAFSGGLIVFGGVLALILVPAGLLAAIMFGLIVGAEVMRQDIEAEMSALRTQYEAVSELAYKLNLELNAAAQRAESAERDLLATAAEKTSLRAQLDARLDGTA